MIADALRPRLAFTEKWRNNKQLFLHEEMWLKSLLLIALVSIENDSPSNGTL